MQGAFQMPVARQMPSHRAAPVRISEFLAGDRLELDGNSDVAIILAGAVDTAHDVRLSGPTAILKTDAYGSAACVIRDLTLICMTLTTCQVQMTQCTRFRALFHRAMSNRLRALAASYPAAVHHRARH